jgi:hypothetical protein
VSEFISQINWWLMQMTMENIKSQVRIQSDLSDPITTKKVINWLVCYLT